jgi:hypothetical protein
LKSLLDSQNDNFDEDEEDSEASLEATVDPQRELFGNSRFGTQDYYPGHEDL